MSGRWDDVVGRLLLRTAAVLHRTVAGEVAYGRWISRRDRTLRAAHRRGLPVDVLAARMGLTQGWIRQRLNSKKPAEPSTLEEAA
ncbi:hypothetical protein GTW30_21910 [Streptomyces sp. SID7810]|nr:hypothetical protein [Streptomyces sp. SID7810]